MNLLKSLLTKPLSKRVLVPASKRFVFLYHDISEPDAVQYSPHYSTTLRTFREHIDALSAHFDFVSLDDITSPAVSKRRLAALTFDDGFLSVKDEALPYLERRGIPFAVFINTSAVTTNKIAYTSVNNSIEKTFNIKVYLDANDVKRLSEKGVCIGSHTANHKVLSGCTAEELQEEITNAKSFIGMLTGSDVKHLALPFGKREHYNEAVLDYCFDAGHEYVYSTNPVYFDEKYLRSTCPIPRIGLTSESKDELYFYINRPLIKTIDI